MSDIFNPNISPGPGYQWNEYGPAGGMWYLPGGVGDPTAPAMGAVGGLYNQPTIGGEAGPEWFVPTYEPERTNFLQNAPDSFWSNLSKAGTGAVSPTSAGSSGESGEVTIHSHIYLDGKEVAESVAKHIPRNAALSESIRRVR
jgi:hypothetical protein